MSSATTSSSQNAFNFLSSGAGKIVFEIFLNLYIGLLFLVLVCSLGNRPQVNLYCFNSWILAYITLKGSKWAYSIAMILFGLCNVITTWCAAFTVYLAVPHDAAGWKDFPQYAFTIALFDRSESDRFMQQTLEDDPCSSTNRRCTWRHIWFILYQLLHAL